MLCGYIVLGAAGVFVLCPIGFTGFISGARFLINGGGSVERLIGSFIFGAHFALNVGLGILGGLDFIGHGLIVGGEAGSGGIPVKRAFRIPGIICGGLGMSETMLFAVLTAHGLFRGRSGIRGEAIIFGMLMINVARGFHLVTVVGMLGLLLGSAVRVLGRILGSVPGYGCHVPAPLRHIGIPNRVVIQFGRRKKLLPDGQILTAPPIHFLLHPIRVGVVQGSQTMKTTNASNDSAFLHSIGHHHIGKQVRVNHKHGFKTG